VGPRTSVNRLVAGSNPARGATSDQRLSNIRACPRGLQIRPWQQGWQHFADFAGDRLLSHEAIWLTRLIRPIWSGGKSLYDRVVGKAPHLNFELDEGGVKLIVHNARQETIIVESVRTDPSVLGFSTGHSVREIAAAVTAQRNPPNDEALAVIPPGERCPLTVITFDPFEKSPPKQAIKVITRGIAQRMVLFLKEPPH
jgi:hypothetical protein